MSGTVGALAVTSLYDVATLIETMITKESCGYDAPNQQAKIDKFKAAMAGDAELKKQVQVTLFARGMLCSHAAKDIDYCGLVISKNLKRLRRRRQRHKPH